jgi:hypothetical protein
VALRWESQRGRVSARYAAYVELIIALVILIDLSFEDISRSSMEPPVSYPAKRWTMFNI